MAGTDAELVEDIRNADRAAFADMYDRYSDRIFDYCYSILNNRDDAADALHDSFITASQRITQLREPDKLRPWLYAIARSTCLASLRASNRTVADDEVDMADVDADPSRSAEQHELRQLVRDAAEGLSEKEQSLLTLHIHGLEGAELGEALGVSANQASVSLSRLRDQLERSLGALLIARKGRSNCTQLAGVLGDWDGTFSTVVRKRVVRHVDDCDACTARRASMVSPWALLAGLPLLTAPLAVRDRVMADVALVAHTSALSGPALAAGAAGSVGAGAVAVAASGGAASSAAHRSNPDNRHKLVNGSAAMLVLLLGVGGFTLTQCGQNEPARKSAKSGPSTAADQVAPQIAVQPLGRSAIPARGCTADSAEVIATVVEPNLSSVTLTWTIDSGQTDSAAMALTNGTWRALLGPFDRVGELKWEVDAVDQAGNRAASPAQKLTVEACTPAKQPESAGPTGNVPTGGGGGAPTPQGPAPSAPQDLTDLPYYGKPQLTIAPPTRPVFPMDPFNSYQNLPGGSGPGSPFGGLSG